MIDHKPKMCSCGHHFDNTSDYELLEKRQVFEIPPQRIDVYEHRIYQALCPVCGKNHKTDFSSTVTAVALYCTFFFFIYKLLLYQPPFYASFFLRKFHTDFYDFSVVCGVWNCIIFCVNLF